MENGRWRLVCCDFQWRAKVVGMVIADLVFARYYLYQKQSRQKYEQIMTHIINNPDIDQNYRLFNEMAARRAKIYLKASDELF